MMRWFAEFFLAWLVTIAPVHAEGRVTLQAGAHSIIAEVAATPAERELGLMGRHRLGANRGMLFVFPETAIHTMWMKDTPLPLSAAFLDENGVVVDLAEMQPYTLTEHAPRRPVKYVLEMSRRWFRHHGVRIGSRIDGVRQAGTGR